MGHGAGVAVASRGAAAAVASGASGAGCCPGGGGGGGVWPGLFEMMSAAIATMAATRHETPNM